MHRLCTALVAVVLAMPTLVAAGICDVAWDGDKVASAIAGRQPALKVPLRDKQQRTTEVTVAQIQAFHEAKTRIAQAAGLSPTFIICNGEEPNAFAAPNSGGHIVGVTIGMLRAIDGDRDMAAAVIGHEFAHHTLLHHSSSQVRDTVIGLFGLVIGVALEAKLQRETGAVTGLGLDLANVGSTLVARKFDRDQERDADQQGLAYMVAGRFNPEGAVRLADRMNRMGTGGAGLFFDTHPGWSERAERFQALIAANAEARQLVAASVPTSPGNARSSTAVTTTTIPADVALAPTYESSDAERSHAAAVEALRTQDFVTAVREFRSAALAGYAPSQLMVGYLYFNGLGGLPKDEVQAARMYKLASDQGNALAQSNLGLLYALGRGGLAKDERAAAALFRISAEQGNRYGQANLAAMYLRGAGGVPKDPHEAVRLFTLSANQGNPYGEAMLGVAYLHGELGLNKDETEAEHLLRRSAGKGHALGQAHLGIVYRRGIGSVPKDDVEAVRLFKLSAGQGNAIGQANLAVMYLRGEGGLPRDETEGRRLTELAAQQGNSFAQNNLGVMYERGAAGLARDIEIAVLWYERSAAQGHTTAQANLRRLGRL